MPNLKKFAALIEIFKEGIPPNTRQREERVGDHRQMRILGGSALMAFRAGDSPSAPAPSFMVSTETYKRLQEVAWTDYDPVLCVPPLQSFYVRPRSPVSVTANDGVISGGVELAGMYALAVGNGDWIISDLLFHEGDVCGTETIARLDRDQVWNPYDRADGYAPFSICGPNVVINERLDYTDCQKIARALVSFLYLINSDAVSVAARMQPTPINRAERRREARAANGRLLDITVPGNISVEELFDDVHAGRRLGPQIAGAIRTEIPHAKSPGVGFVSASSRYKQLERLLRGPSNATDV